MFVPYTVEGVLHSGRENVVSRADPPSVRSKGVEGGQGRERVLMGWMSGEVSVMFGLQQVFGIALGTRDAVMMERGALSDASREMRAGMRRDRLERQKLKPRRLIEQSPSASLLRESSQERAGMGMVVGTFGLWGETAKPKSVCRRPSISGVMSSPSSPAIGGRRRKRLGHPIEGKEKAWPYIFRRRAQHDALPKQFSHA